MLAPELNKGDSGTSLQLSGGGLLVEVVLLMYLPTTDSFFPCHLQKDRFEYDDLKATVEVLTHLQSKDSSLSGPVYDCIVFEDGHSWWYA